MKITRVLLALCLFTATLAAAPSKETLSRPVSGQRRLSYLCFKPEGFDAKAGVKWPLIIFLHGSGERGWDLKGVTAHGLPKWLAAGHTVPAVVLAPQCPPTRWWEPEDVDAMIDEAVEKYGIDEDRILLTGFSMGGYGSFAYAARSGWRLAGVVPVAGALESRNINGLKDTNVWIFCGSKDTAVPPEGGRAAQAALKAAGLDPKFTEFPEADHTGSARLAYEETPELYEWMLKQRRNPEGLSRFESQSMGFDSEEGILMAPGSSRDFDFVVRNLSSRKKHYDFAWSQASKRWSLGLAEKSKDLAPGEELRLKGTAKFQSGNASPAEFLPQPKLKTVVDGKVTVETELPAGLDNSSLILKAGKAGFGLAQDRFYPVGDWSAKGPKTEVLASWDESNLRLKVRSLGETGPAPKPLLHGHDENIWTEDSIEFFLMPDLQKKSDYAQCAINRAGSMYDAWVYDRGWESSAKATAKEVKGGWELELLIPFTSLKMIPAAGAKLGFEVVRNAYVPGKHWSLQWAPTFAGSHAPERYGVLELAGK
jgi:predicted esterase